jgi:hypothetical protein
MIQAVQNQTAVARREEEQLIKTINKLLVNAAHIELYDKRLESVGTSPASNKEAVLKPVLSREQIMRATFSRCCLNLLITNLLFNNNISCQCNRNDHKHVGSGGLPNHLGRAGITISFSD